MFGSAGTGVAATSYLSEDSDMLGAEAAYADMEADLQYELCLLYTSRDWAHIRRAFHRAVGRL